MNGNKLHKVVL